MESKVLIVGGSGYLGQHLIPMLKNNGYKVWYTGLENNNSEDYYKIDFSDKSTFEKLLGESFDMVIILASKLNAMNTYSLSHEDLKNNVFDYGNFLDFINEQKLTSRIVYFSSMTVYGIQNTVPVSEEGVLQPLHTYGLSKLLAENITSFFCERAKIKGVIIRIPGLYGGNRRNGFIYNIIRKIKAGEEINIKSKGLGYWETIHVNDMCDLLVGFLENYNWNNSIDTFNLSYGEETDFYETARYIAKELNYQKDILFEEEKGYIPFFLSNQKINTIVKVNCDYITSLKKYTHSV